MTEDIRHWLDLIQATKDRLKPLELQKARYGLAAPPHVETEIAQAHKDIELYTAQIYSGVPPSEKAKNDVNGDPETLLLQFRVQQVEQQLRDGLTVIQKQIGDLTEHVTRMDATSQEYRKGEREIRIERQEEHDERMTLMEQQFDTLSGHTDRLAEEVRWTPWRMAAIAVIGLIVTVIAIWILR